MSELTEIRERTVRIETKLDDMKEARLERDVWVSARFEKGASEMKVIHRRINGVEKKIWWASGALAALVAILKFYFGK